VVLAEVTGGIAGVLQNLCETGGGGFQTESIAGLTDGGHSGANRILAGNECRPTGRAGWLGVVIGEADPFHADPVNVGRRIAHGSHSVSADVLPAYVVAPDHKNVGFFSDADAVSVSTVPKTAIRKYFIFVLLSNWGWLILRG
jgi:hypothetical protein